MSLKRKLDDETINLIHHKAWDKQIEKYGSAVAVPREKADLIAERDRAMYCLQVWVRKGEQGSVYAHLRSYSLRLGTLEWVIKKFCEEEDLTPPEKRKNQKARWRDLETHAIEHAYEQFTTAELAEIGGFSTQTVLKWLATSRHYNKIKRGLYEARNPNQKSSAKSK
ncbi:MAG: hypothetical protein MK239_08585 [Gemmatimonadetes bacterium]|nr:hypothetical protein [Gemmatimonadota bacterium]